MPHRPQRIGNYPVLKKDTPQVTFASCLGAIGTEPGRGVSTVRVVSNISLRGAITLVMGSQDSVNVPANRYNYKVVPLALPRGYSQAQTFLCAYNFEFSADFSQHNLLLGGLFVGRIHSASAPVAHTSHPAMQDSIYMLPLQTSYVNATGDHCNASASGAFVMEYEPSGTQVDIPVIGWYTHNASAGVVNVDDMVASLSWHVYEEDIPIFDPNR